MLHCRWKVNSIFYNNSVITCALIYDDILLTVNSIREEMFFHLVDQYSNIHIYISISYTNIVYFNESFISPGQERIY